MEDLITRDLKHLWHPCSQMKDYETFPPIPISHAEGAYLYRPDGSSLIDAISSWWCKSLGHNHPRLKQALIQQLDKFEHVILANTTNETIVKLSEKLAGLGPGLDKVFYASDGSCAVEIALKMSVHARYIKGETQRTRFMALANGFHGETLYAMSVSDLGLYRNPYNAVLPDAHFITDIPYVSGVDDPLWHDCSEIWPAIETQLNQHAEHLTAIIVEPILQGVGGMQIYSKDFLYRLHVWARANNIHLIADEILTGLGRTGLPLACQHADIIPDFICLSKGLTAGVIPMSAVLTSTEIYNEFYDDYATGKAFMHSHTHTGNALAAAVALEVLTILEEDNIYQQVQDKAKIMQEMMVGVAQATGQLHNIRGIGGMVAADLIVDDPNERRGYQVYQKAVELGALLRPLGNTIYWLPPLNTSIETLEKLKDITIQAINSLQ